MVKADVRRDYYADLGLTPSADAEDIKKQFRKLALKYHPDRNPGRELEFNAKFQAIQAAHEILSDPQQRLKYDTDRLRAGYGKLYGPNKANTARKAPTNPYASASTAKPQTPKPPFSSRPQSFHNGPSTGAQRYASYARAAPKQPWEKTQDEGQTRADAYRGFQEMKGNSTPGWSHFDPRTGRAGYTGAARPDATPNGHPTRPKSAYEYFKTSPKTTANESSRTQSTRKKQGFAPRTAGGDEPMAPNTSSYTSVPRRERFQTPDSFQRETAPSPTAERPAATSGYRAENTRTPDIERTGSKYAGTGGERTFFSSSWLRLESVRNSPKSSRAQSRTNPPSPTPPPTGRHKSASPKLRSDRGRNYDSTSSSGTENEFISRKPKAVPKSRLQNHKYANFRSQTGSTPMAEPAKPASSENIFGAFSSNSNPAPNEGQAPQNGAFKSSSHDDLRKPFTADSWKGDFGFGSFTSSTAENGRSEFNHRPNSRGRTSTRASPSRAGQPGPFSQDSSRSASVSQQPPTAFPEAKFSVDEWAAKLKDVQWTMPQSEEASQWANTQRQRSPKKQTKFGIKMRPTPQPASVATEAEESRTTVEGSSKQEATGTGAEEVEAMDLDDDVPSKNTDGGFQTDKASKDQVTQPSSGVDSKDTGASFKSCLFNLNDLSSTAPFTNTNNGGIEDLQDIHATLPFESRAKAPRTTARDVRPRKLICPNPPKRPTPPELVPISAGSQQLGLPRGAWDRYIAEMGAYMREWNAFNRRLLRHFNARQDAMETGMAPNWIGAVGDSTRIKINEPSGEDDEKATREDDDDAESDDAMVAGSAKAGFSAYLRAFDEDERVHKHWEVARENHRKCIVQLGEMREWILNGGKLI